MDRDPLLERTGANRAAETSLDDAWSESGEHSAARLDDYSSIIFNLHAFSYRLPHHEFAAVERRAELRQAGAAGAGGAGTAPAGDAEEPAAPAAASTMPRLRSLTGHQPPAGRQWQQLQQPRQQDEWRQQQQYAGAASEGRQLLRSHSTKLSPGGPQRSALNLPVLPVNHPFQASWSILMIAVDLSYTAVLLPLLLAFGRLDPSLATYWLNVAMGFLFLADMLVVLHRGVVVRYLDRHVYVDHPGEVARLYATRGHLWADLPIALSGPLQLLILLPRVAESESGRWVLLLVNLLILLRGMRLIKLLLLSRELFFGKLGFRHMGATIYRYYMLSLVYVLGVLINWLACIMLSISQWEGPGSSWLADVKGQDLSMAPPGQQYMAAFYWMLISTMTVGYGDISAATVVEQAAVVGAVLVGVIFIAYAVKSLMDVMLEATLQDEQAQRMATLRGRAAQLKLWAQWQDLPEDQVDKLFRFYLGPWLTNAVVCRHWADVLQPLPALLRGQLLETLLVSRPCQELSPLLVRLLAGIPPSAAWHVLALLQPWPLAPGQQLCWEDEPAEFLWLLQEGSVAALDGVVPSEATITGTPGMIVAFNAASWLQQQQHAGAARLAPGAAPAAAPVLRYDRSYQTVATSFFFALPLQQLHLACRGLPQLLDNLAAELLLPLPSA